MGDREEMLAAMRMENPQNIVIKDIATPQTFKNKLEEFKKRFSEDAGIVIESNGQSLNEIFKTNKITGKNIIGFEDIELDGYKKLTSDTAPKSLGDTDVTIVRAKFAVAESAACWVVPQEDLPRVALFCASTLVILLKSSEIIDNMHEAYEKVDFNELCSAGYFIAGPSKTADIECITIIGAHGPLKTYLILD